MRTLFATLFLLMTQLLTAQQPLGQYVQQALTNNFGLQQQQAEYAQAQTRLDQARALFWPRLSIEGRYSMARGGRTFDIPTGDLVNPAYQNLNAINPAIQGADPSYPAFPSYPNISNESVNFLRETEQETVLRLEVPVFNANINRNQALEEARLIAESAGLDQYRQQLIRDVHQAYYRYAQASAARNIYQEALALVEENLRVTERLQAYEKVTAVETYAARAELARVQQELIATEQQLRTAQAYFNTLLNLPYETPISLPDTEEVSLILPWNLAQSEQQAWQNRPELTQLRAYSSAREQQSRLATANRLPTLSLRADYGIQGTTYRFGADDDFMLASLVFSVPLFDRTTSAKVQEAKLGQEAMDYQLAAVRQQVGLQLRQQYYALEAASASLTQAKAEKAAAAEAFRLVRKLYEQGQSNQLSFFDARSRLTQAEQQLSIAHYHWLIQQAEWQYLTGSY